MDAEEKLSPDPQELIEGQERPDNAEVAEVAGAAGDTVVGNVVTEIPVTEGAEASSRGRVLNPQKAQEMAIASDENRTKAAKVREAINVAENSTSAGFMTADQQRVLEEMRGQAQWYDQAADKTEEEVASKTPDWIEDPAEAHEVANATDLQETMIANLKKLGEGAADRWINELQRDADKLGEEARDNYLLEKARQQVEEREEQQRFNELRRQMIGRAMEIAAGTIGEKDQPVAALTAEAKPFWIRDEEGKIMVREPSYDHSYALGKYEISTPEKELTPEHVAELRQALYQMFGAKTPEDSDFDLKTTDTKDVYLEVDEETGSTRKIGNSDPVFRWLSRKFDRNGKPHVTRARLETKGNIPGVTIVEERVVTGGSYPEAPAGVGVEDMRYAPEGMRGLSISIKRN